MHVLLGLRKSRLHVSFISCSHGPRVGLTLFHEATGILAPPTIPSAAFGIDMGVLGTSVSCHLRIWHWTRTRFCQKMDGMGKKARDQVRWAEVVVRSATVHKSSSPLKGRLLTMCTSDTKTHLINALSLPLVCFSSRGSFSNCGIGDMRGRLLSADSFSRSWRDSVHPTSHMIAFLPRML